MPYMENGVLNITNQAHRNDTEQNTRKSSFLECVNNFEKINYLQLMCWLCICKQSLTFMI